MKSEKGVLSPNQKNWIERLKEQDYRVEVCYSATEAIKTIENYLNIKLLK